ncbi:hypothetical protein LTR41_011655 [Exophiala xenobiotica]|nr:hypothetical protein LTR41_011655 [Exophiala xenobiotica]KAK5550493.1 hypothetical protein LTR46_011504 [Exophiala xenobiotica]
MRRLIRTKLLVTFILLMLNSILLAIVKTKQDPYDLISFLKASASAPWSRAPLRGAKEDLSCSKDKIVVTPARDVDDISWIERELPDWQYAIYYVDHPSTVGRADSLRTPVNKGNEAMAYLTYIIDHYHTQIPEVVAFLHSHRNGFWKAWHVDDPLHDNARAMQHVRLDFVIQHGYVNLRCNWTPGCTKTSEPNPHFGNQTWDEIFANTSTPYFDPTSGRPAAASHETTLTSFQSGEDASARHIWTPCCAQFTVSRDQIYRRPFQDYVNIRRWLLDTELEDAHSGRILEYLWHVIFGKEAVQ